VLTPKAVVRPSASERRHHQRLVSTNNNEQRKNMNTKEWVDANVWDGEDRTGAKNDWVQFTNCLTIIMQT
jgi:hypothetical protein